MDNYLTPSHNAIVSGATIEGAMESAKTAIKEMGAISDLSYPDAFKVGEPYKIMTDPLFEVRFGISDTNIAGENRFSVSIMLVKK
ncbi:hypothetical protein GGF41_004106 [Coemansia sp. RSA 2531]|nr:hypothetical protein GGF41_004106 [Coemansia sp. RSA 2531]